MSISNKGEPIQQLPSVLGYINTVLNRKSKTEDEHHQKFKFTSDLIFGHLVEERQRTSTPVVQIKQEKSPVSRDLSVETRTVKSCLYVPTAADLLSLDNMKTNPLIMGTQKLPAKGTAYSVKRTAKLTDQVIQRAERKFSIDDILGFDRKDLAIVKEDIANKNNAQKDFTINQNSKQTNKSAKTGMLERNNKIVAAKSNRLKEEATIDSRKNRSDEKQGKLPNISQFFEPIDKIIDFKACAASRCEVDSQETATNSWVTRGPNNTTFPCQILDFPVLRNTGRLEFHRSPFQLLGDKVCKSQERKNVKFQVDVALEDIKSVKGSSTPTEPTANNMEIKSTTSLIDENNKPSAYGQSEQSEQSAKGFRCEKCGKIYCRKYVLKIHMRTHSGEKPLKCQICGKCFSDPSNMKKHVKLHETDHVTYPCKFCGRNFVRRRGLLNHLHSMHSRFPVVHSQV